MLGAIPGPLRAACATLCREVRAAGGRALLVGGCVRDGLLGFPVKDVDIEVFGLPAGRLEEVLVEHWEVVGVGKSFGVFKLRGLEIDVSLPRREAKTGSGHKGFVVEGDPSMSYAEAAARRDLTINAISFDPLEDELIDPLGGRADLEARRLRHTGPRFAEDPLRVLRAMQIAARFELAVDPSTVDLCAGIEPETLPPERVFEEWRKLILRGRRPSLGLDFLRACGWVRYSPELEALIGCEQDPGWHPEGDVWVHTLHCMDAFAGGRTGDDWEDLVVGFAVLCHDLGKPPTTRFEDGRIRSRGHEAEGEPLTRSFLGRMTRHRDLVEAVVPLVVNHLRPVEFYKSRAGDAAVRRLARKVGRIDRLVRVATADMKGRPPIVVEDFEAGRWLLGRATALEVEDRAPVRIVLGRHLIELGEEPGPAFKGVLERCYEAQLDGVFTDLEGGRAYARSLLAGDLDP